MEENMKSVEMGNNLETLARVHTHTHTSSLTNNKIYKLKKYKR